jgi:predicted lipid-binding transport protein (Tim44 family)
MRRSMAAVLLALAVVGPLLWAEEAPARAGRGGSSGARGSRSSSVPARPPAAPSTPTRPAAPAPTLGAASRSGESAMGRFLAGGLLGGLLFGGSGPEMGLLDVLALLLLASFAWNLLKTGAPKPARTFASDDGALLSARADRDRGTPEVRPIGATFDKAGFAESAVAMFTQVQAAWCARDVGPVVALLTPEMKAELQRDCERMTAKGRTNHLDDIAVRAADVVGTWQEQGHDYATLRIEAGLFDYTTDDATGEVVEGSASEPVTFEEFWTFTRPVWAKTWRVSAIQQPVPAGH